MKSVRFILLLCLVCVLSSTFGFCSEEGKEGSGGFIQKMATLGGIRDAPNQNSVEIGELARFAVDEYNKKQNALLEFVRVVKAKEQVVAGTMYHLTVEAIEAGNKKLYDAKVWVKPWMNFKQLEEFKPAGNSLDASA